MTVELEITKPFISAINTSEVVNPGLYLLGICYDGTTSFRPGTRFGPDALRLASYGLESYSPYADFNIENIDIYDLGNLPQFTSRFDLIEKNFKELFAKTTLGQDKRLITFGGEHSLSRLPIQKHLESHPELVVIQLDAHADLREAYLEDMNSHASVMRRVYESLNSQQRLIQYGIRSGTQEEFNFMKEKNTLIESKEAFLETLYNIEDSRPVYITLDLDFFDPSELPGTGTPEAGGARFNDFIDILKVLRSKNVIGADVVELSPPIDSTGNSDCFAAKITRELIALIGRP
jgi:agmatinase